MNTMPESQTDDGEPAASAERRNSNRTTVTWLRYAQWVAVAVGVVCIVVIFRALPTKELLSGLQDWIVSLGVWGPVVLTLTYIVATVLMVPGTILTLVAGALYGLTVGTVVVSIGATVGASLCFLIGRYAVRERIANWAKRYPRFDAIDRAIGEGGWKVVALLRLSPAIPFNVQNYLYGLTRIRFWPFAIASWLAMLPGTFLYVYLGHVTQAALTSDRGRSVGEWILLAVGLIATLVVSVYIARLARSKITQEVSTSSASDEVEQDPPEDEPQEASFSSQVVRTLALVVVAGILVVLAINSHHFDTWLAPYLP